jgi:hypothetical protein
VAHVNVAQGGQVVPQTLLQVSGAKSLAADGSPVVQYLWSVQPPAGANAAVVPNESFPNVTGNCLMVLQGLGVKTVAKVRIHPLPA